MPIPRVEADTQEYWEACNEHRLVVQQCLVCKEFRFGPSPICHACHSFEYESVESAGVGEVYTWTVTHHSVHPATADAVPYNSVVVQLSDCGGAKIISNLIDVDNDEIEAGMRVEVVWQQVSDDITIPRFRPIR